MEVFYLTYPLTQPIQRAASSVAIGNFDGIHKGHQEVIDTAIRSSKKLHIKSSVMTFHPHPKEVLGRKTDQSCLTPMTEKLKVFEDAGVDICYVVNFDASFSRISKKQFINTFLSKLKISAITIGSDFRFGRLGQGQPIDFFQSPIFSEVNVIKSLNTDNEKISSTYIRKLIKQGEVETANHLLGRSYKIIAAPFSVIEKRRIMDTRLYSVQCKISNHFTLPNKGLYSMQLKRKNTPFIGIASFFPGTYSEKKAGRTIGLELIGTGDLDYSTIDISFVGKVSSTLDKDFHLYQMFENQLLLAL
ncbi:FAD synthetase family protein [Alteribacillus sp. YIM 98480]|uniref:FAD synthetase family protein n=1 Tax=Alteribacillus sp. YIM 98480 TaxID=2606599 RepID=UPI00131A832A|nr:FAD synthetase family protein [Alteribacillus sp. YIM 98480]